MKIKQGRKIISNYATFLINRKTCQKMQRIGKTLACMSIKRGVSVVLLPIGLILMAHCVNSYTSM